jgi:hypothetical protein
MVGCKGCAHFFVTYDPLFPYGCRALAFKSKRMPSAEVEEASGSPCEARILRKSSRRGDAVNSGEA